MKIILSVQFEVASYVIENTELSCKIESDVVINRALKFVLKTICIFFCDGSS